MSIRRKTIYSIITLFILNTILLMTYYHFFIVKNINKKQTEVNQRYEQTLQEIVPILENSTLDSIDVIADSIIERYDAIINIKDSNGKTIYTNDKDTASEIYKVTTLIEIEDSNYLVTYYDDSDVTISSFNIARDLIIFQVLLLILFGVGGIFTANSKVLSPLVKLQNDMKNYKYGILPKYSKIKTNLDEMQNTFVSVVEDLEKEKNKQSRIIASISHDIKTPLTSIMGYADRLKNVELKEETKKEYINKIYNKSLDMKELIEEFDDYLSCNIKETLKMEKIMVKELLNELRNDYNLDLNEKNIKLIIKSNCDKNSLLIDKIKIKRVFSNIISNSIKHSKNEKLEITIYATKKGNEILFTVSDNGGGVKKEDINKIFEPLYTTDPGRKIPGLGLSICKQIIELHGGTIEAKNNINKGLSISFALKRRLI